MRGGDGGGGAMGREMGESHSGEKVSGGSGGESDMASSVLVEESAGTAALKECKFNACNIRPSILG